MLLEQSDVLPIQISCLRSRNNAREWKHIKLAILLKPKRFGGRASSCERAYWGVSTRKVFQSYMILSTL